MRRGSLWSAEGEIARHRESDSDDVERGFNEGLIWSAGE